MDQIAARALGQHTQLASLELGLEGANFAGSCDSGGFSCAFSYTISWWNASTPLPMEHNPRAVFERLFGDSENTDPAARRARLREQRSMLDSVSDDVARLRRSLGPSDRDKVGAYLDAVCDVERRIQMAEAQGDQAVPLMARPLGVPADFVDHATLMYDLWLLAYQIDRTRIVTFMKGHELSGRTYPEIGVPDAHHPLSHHQGVPAALEKLTKLNTHHVTLFASFLDKLRATPDGDGSLLDHTVIVYGAGMSDSNAHSPYNLPILLLGGGAGQLEGGRHLVYPEGTPLATCMSRCSTSWVRPSRASATVVGRYRTSSRRTPIGCRVCSKSERRSQKSEVRRQRSGGSRRASPVGSSAVCEVTQMRLRRRRELPGAPSWSRWVLATAGLVVAAGSGIGAQGVDLRLLEAVKAQDPETVRELLARQADVNARETSQHQTAPACWSWPRSAGTGRSHGFSWTSEPTRMPPRSAIRRCMPRC